MDEGDSADGQLPCNSGMRIETMSADITITTSVQSLRQLATLRLSTVVNCLAAALESLAKVSNAVMGIMREKLTESTLSRDLRWNFL